LVVFSQVADALPWLYLSRADGTPIPLGQQGEHAAWSPDGRQLVFRSERDGGGLFVLDVTTKEVRQLVAEGFHPAWSPNGTHVAYSTERYTRPEARLTTRSRLSAVEVTTSAVHPLTLLAPMDDAIEPAWSPDGRWIAFWSVDSGGRRDVFVMPAAGGRAVRVTDPDPMDWNPTWSPDGRLYWSSNQGGTTNLWRVPITNAGTLAGPPEAVPLPTSYAGFFSFDRSGQLMYANVRTLSSVFRTEVALDGRSASTPVRLTPETLRVRHPSLSPDGSHVVSYALDPQEDLVVFRRDGTGLRRLTDDAFGDRGPAWSPDGGRIAFVSNRGGDYQLWSVQADGHGLAPLTRHPDGAFAPVWSRDGEQIAWFERGRRAKLTRVAGAAPTTIDLGPAAFAPTAWWQMDTALLGALAATDDEADTPLISYGLDTGTVREFGVRGRGPRWLVEGRVLLFLRGNGFHSLDVITGAERQILSLPGAVSNRYALSADRMLYFDMEESRAELWTARLP
jgi:Tol biopolymer transport system component